MIDTRHTFTFDNCALICNYDSCLLWLSWKYDNLCAHAFYVHDYDKLKHLCLIFCHQPYTSLQWEPYIEKMITVEY